MNNKPNHLLRDPPRILTINGGSSSIKSALYLVTVRCHEKRVSR